VRLTSQVHLVGGGRNGLGLTDVNDCNVYLIDGGSEYALVDAGAGYDLDRLLAEIAQSSADLDRIGYILLTHKHADHSGGTAELQRLTGARVYGTSATAAAVGDADGFNTGLARARNAGTYPLDYVFQAVTVDDVVSGGDGIRVGSLDVRVIDTPGHCAGHCSFVMPSEHGTCLFSGDALFPQGEIMLLPIADSSIQESLASVESLASLDIDALFAGHGAPILSGGDRHVQLALDRIREGKLPVQLM